MDKIFDPTRYLIPLPRVADNPWQTRPINPEKVASLAADIQQNGLLQPPVGRVVNLAGDLVPERFWTDHALTRADSTHLVEVLAQTGFTVQIAFGHHRLAAYRALVGDGLTPVYVERFGNFPVDILPLTNEQMAMFGWSENEQRGDLSEVEKAEAIQRYITDFGWTQEQAAQKLGINRSTVANKLRLLKLGSSELTAPVLAALREGKISERQAMPLLSLIDQPKEVLETAEKAQYGNKPSEVIRCTLSGAWTSDSVRSQVASAIKTGMRQLSGEAILVETFEGEGFISPACTGCPRRVQIQEDHFCQSVSCFARKKDALAARKGLAASAATGLPIVAKDLGYNEYETFYGEDAPVMVRRYQEHRCEHMALKEGYASQSLPGADGYGLICRHEKGGKCTCLAAAKRDFKKNDPGEIAKKEAAKTAQVLIKEAETLFGVALLEEDQAAWYYLWKEVKPYDDKSKLNQGSDLADVQRAVIKVIVNRAIGYMDMESPKLLETLQKKLVEILSACGKQASWMDALPTAADQAWSKFTRIQDWLHDLPREFPTVKMLRGNIDNLRKLIETTGLTPDQSIAIIHAHQDLERLLPLVEDWTADDQFGLVNGLVTVPPGDGNFTSALAQSSTRVVQYALAIIPEAQNKIKRQAMEGRLRQLQKESAGTLAQVLAGQERADERCPDCGGPMAREPQTDGWIWLHCKPCDKYVPIDEKVEEA